MLIAVLSDIHSNLPALQAVAADLKELQPDAVYVLGDVVNGCPWPAEVIDFLLDRGWPSLMGNHDDAVLQLGTPRMEARYAHRDRYGVLWWTRDRLDDRRLAALEGLPLEIKVKGDGMPPLRLVHGIPGNFFVGFAPGAPDEWVSRRLATVAEPAIAGGHTHIQMVRAVDGHLIVNSGSVGMPYDGDCRAGYAWLASDGGGWRAGVRRVRYDVDAVDSGFKRSDLLDQGGVMAEMTRRSVTSGLPWIADFAWWVRDQPAELLADMRTAQARYDSVHGPGHWAFPYA
ncbi:MAG TPA: metallophosphoesterase family protein [Anaerolineae bacterium]